MKRIIVCVAMLVPMLFLSFLSSSQDSLQDKLRKEVDEAKYKSHTDYTWRERNYEEEMRSAVRSRDVKAEMLMDDLVSALLKADPGEDEALIRRLNAEIASLKLEMSQFRQFQWKFPMRIFR